MTDEQLSAMEANAQRFDDQRGAVWVSGCAIHVLTLVAEVRRLWAERDADLTLTVPALSPEAVADLQAKLQAATGGARNSRRVLVLGKPPVLSAPLKGEEDKQRAIADLQRTPVEKLVQVWDPAEVFIGIGVKTRLLSETGRSPLATGAAEIATCEAINRARWAMFTHGVQMDGKARPDDGEPDAPCVVNG